MTNGCSPFFDKRLKFLFFNLLKHNAKEFLVHSLVLIICNFNPKKEILDNKTEQICFYHLSPACLCSTCVLYFNNDIIKADLFFGQTNVQIFVGSLKLASLVTVWGSVVKISAVTNAHYLHVIVYVCIH